MSEPRIFRPLTIALLLAVGVIGFIGTLLLGAFAPDMRSGSNGGAHALSRAVIGYSGLLRLTEATGRNPQVLRGPAGLDTEDLVVLTPERGAAQLDPLLEPREGRPTLVVLPKWRAESDPKKPAWVRVGGFLPRAEPEGVFAPGTRLKVRIVRSDGRPLIAVDHAPAAMRFVAPRPLQVMEGSGLTPLLTDDRGRVVLAQLPGRTVYVLSDPDLLNNRGMASLPQARAALAMLDFLNSNEATSVSFDVTLNGLGRSPSPLKLLFQPPFLAMTLAIAVVLLLAGWQAFAVFGAPRRPERAIAFGKAALIDNTAALVRRAGRESGLGGRYADAVRARAATLFGVPARLTGDTLDAYLDRLAGGTRFSALTRAAEQAHGRDAVLAAAQDLDTWRREKNG
jgi:hypothetical protein